MVRTEWLDEKKYPAPGNRFPIPAAAQFLLKGRPDLAKFSAATEDDRLTLYFWWEQIGQYDCTDLVWLLDPTDQDWISGMSGEEFLVSYPKAVDYWLRYRWSSGVDLSNLRKYLVQPEPDLSASVVQWPILIKFIWNTRPDLKSAYRSSVDLDRANLLRWWDIYGRREYPRIDWSSRPLLTSLYARSKSNGLETYLAMPTIAKLLWLVREDLQRAFQLNTLVGCLNFFSWWLQDGVNFFPEVSCNIAQTDMVNLLKMISLQDAKIIFHDEFDSVDDMRAIPMFLHTILHERADLKAEFIREQDGFVDAACAWWHTKGRFEYQSLGFVDIRGEPLESSMPGAPRLKLVLVVDNPFYCKAPGVDVVGYPRGMLGIGEDARLASNCLDLQGIANCLVEAPISGPEKVVEVPSSKLSLHLRHGISLFCLPPFEMMRLALEGGRYFIEDSSYKIGAWPWELPHWPLAFESAHQFVDEIWAQSAFVASAFARLGSKPVVRMPMAVVLDKPTLNVRQKLGLPSHDFLFYVLFDGNSWLSRKNPVAAVQAFAKAFAIGGRGVGLVVKAMNVKADDPQWQQICKLAAADPRMHLLNSRMTRQDTINLMDSCDAYISLHRSEGFGRVVAESMLLGKPVVVTNFSGNVDFCDASTSYLVDGELVPLAAGDYLLYEGQYWCDPSVDMASLQLQAIMDDSKSRERIAQAGQARIQDWYSVETVGRKYRERLVKIDARLAAA